MRCNRRRRSKGRRSRIRGTQVYPARYVRAVRVDVRFERAAGLHRDCGSLRSHQGKQDEEVGVREELGR
eukprot:scaffold140_cov247-Pinguiococcus_pyrenoidosus.AAC.11